MRMLQGNCCLLSLATTISPVEFRLYGLQLRRNKTRGERKSTDCTLANKTSSTTNRQTLGFASLSDTLYLASRWVFWTDCPVCRWVPIVWWACDRLSHRPCSSLCTCRPWSSCTTTRRPGSQLERSYPESTAPDLQPIHTGRQINKSMNQSITLFI